MGPIRFWPETKKKLRNEEISNKNDQLTSFLDWNLALNSRTLIWTVCFELMIDIFLLKIINNYKALRYQVDFNSYWDYRRSYRLIVDATEDIPGFSAIR